MITSAINKEIQEGLSPDTVLKDLMEGNERFINQNMLARDYSAQIRDTKEGRWPKAVVLGCIDSRVPVEKFLIRDWGIFLLPVLL